MKKLLMLFLVGAVPVFSAEAPAMIRGTRALGMGDAVTAIADDQNVFFYNPAGTVQRTGSLVNFVNVSLTASKDAIDFYQFLDDNESALKDFDTLPITEQVALGNRIQNEMVPLKPSFGLSAPNVSYLSGPLFGRFHWGAGFFGQVSGRAGFKPIIVTPQLYYDINVDVIPAGNMAVKLKNIPRVPGTLGLGANMKFIRRGRIEEPGADVFALDDYSTPPAQIGRGVGWDFGTLYQPTPRWNVALVVADFGGTKIDFDAREAEDGYAAKDPYSETIPARWNMGVAWTPARLGLPSFGLPLRDRLVLAADLRDFANKESKVFENGGLADTAGTHFHLGAEYRWWFLRLRAGANQGYFTGGVGIDWPALKLDYAYYADELSPFAGSSRHPAHRISFTLGFGSGKTESRERIKAAKVLKSPPVSRPSAPTPRTLPAKK
ncbi:MAG: hypothetical protein JNK54_06540 [Elusimicrobia bacterium]|jgi:hypothetical protein|nr:hypothetical protein [Elusimicrobiota bacterium]